MCCLVSGLLRPKLFPFGKLSKAKPAAQIGSRNRIQMCGQIRIALGIKKNLYWLLIFQNAPLMRCRHYHILSGKSENILERYLLNFFAVLVASYFVPWLNSWYLFVHSSSSNMFFKIAKRLLEGCGEKVILSAALEYVLLVHRNLLECSWGDLKILLEFNVIGTNLQ